MLRKTSAKTGPRIGAERAVRVVCIAAAFLTAFTVPGCSGEANASDAGVSAQTVPERDRATVEVRGPPANRAWVIFGTDTIVAEIARTPDERAQGLMYRDELPARYHGGEPGTDRVRHPARALRTVIPSLS